MFGVAWRAEMRITERDRRGAAEMEHYVRNEDEEVPPMDRFNVGQKDFFWGMLAAGSCCC